jgi:hypothetical protein
MRRRVGVCFILEAKAALPTCEQCLATDRKVFIEHILVKDTIGAEMAKIIA